MNEPEPCEGCGAEPVCVTRLGDYRETWLSTCRCPRPCCIRCEKPLDENGYCTTTLCPMDGLLVPLPVML